FKWGRPLGAVNVTLIATPRFCSDCGVLVRLMSAGIDRYDYIEALLTAGTLRVGCMNQTPAQKRSL
ncbi:MAG: hypothetical protein WCD13_08165, partial [Pseudolabrys sp.]